MRERQASRSVYNCLLGVMSIGMGVGGMVLTGYTQASDESRGDSRINLDPLKSSNLNHAMNVSIGMICTGIGLVVYECCRVAIGVEEEPNEGGNLSLEGNEEELNESGSLSLGGDEEALNEGGNLLFGRQ